MSFRTVCCKIEMLFGKIGRKNMYEKNSLSLRILYRFFGEDSVFYINGAQTLPAPLDAAGEAKLLAQLKSDDSREAENAKNRLVERNLRLVVYIA